MCGVPQKREKMQKKTYNSATSILNSKYKSAYPLKCEYGILQQLLIAIHIPIFCIVTWYAIAKEKTVDNNNSAARNRWLCF